jgi:hypothetical protein
MKKFILLFLLLTPFVTVFSQDPGFGDEGGGDAQTAPPAPINKNLNEGILIGIVIAGYFFMQKREKQLK